MRFMREGMCSLGQNVHDFCVWFPDNKDMEIGEKICSMDPIFADPVSLICYGIVTTFFLFSFQLNKCCYEK